jgi:FtsH-binding integral membrane protein
MKNLKELKSTIVGSVILVFGLVWGVIMSEPNDNTLIGVAAYYMMPIGLIAIGILLIFAKDKLFNTLFKWIGNKKQ